ncbi:MAG: metallophosphoesterase [Bacteroidota bacterium]
MRLIHLTDIHINATPEAETGLRACLEQVNALAPEFIINGGDSVRDALKDDPATVDIHWEHFHRIFNEETKIPIEHLVGNHDVLAAVPAEQAKESVKQQLSLANTYRSVIRENWKFILLDSTRLKPDQSWYEAGLDPAQLDWLKLELQQTPPDQHICVVSHIPILAACTFLDGDNVKDGNWVVPGAWMHLDAAELVNLFANYPNIKLCLSGHIHLHDRVQYNGITYICSGAVSGNWWKGSYQQTPPGFGLIDLNADGSFHYEYILVEN